jgi:hypothetical protein
MGGDNTRGLARVEARSAKKSRIQLDLDLSFSVVAAA